MTLPTANAIRWLRRFQWTRGLRAAAVVGSSLAAAHTLGLPASAIALGAFNPLLVDNGGPYRARLTTMLTTILGGAVAYMAGALLPSHIAIIIPATMLTAFAVTYARLLSQQMASSSVLILVLYFAGLGGTLHTLPTASFAACFVIAGGFWAIILSLFFWPIDSFRPARQSVADCFRWMAEFTARLADEGLSSATEVESMDPKFEWRRQQRVRLEQARETLSATAARAPSRTIRFRVLTVLLETSDMLLGRTMRLAELRATALRLHLDAAAALAGGITNWLGAAEFAIAAALAQKPANNAASFARDGSMRLEFVIRRPQALAHRQPAAGDPLYAHLLREERDALLEIEIAFDAVRALWTGTEAPSPSFASTLSRDATPRWVDAIQANWTMRSTAFRHALRLMAVGAADVIVMRLIHINHGFWLPMTSILLMQPFSAGTVRKSVQRVTGTIGGGILAAVLAASISSPELMLGVITILSGLTVATFAVDYAIYCLFLTPTFVLVSLPHPHDWQYAFIRIGTTFAGALIAVLAMRLLWPERADEELGPLLRRGAGTASTYLEKTLSFWQLKPDAQAAAERELLAPARRACGMASNDAEEAVDRILQEPVFGRTSGAETILRTEALTFTTYLRRLTQSITTLALVGADSPERRRRLEPITERLSRIANGDELQPAPAGDQDDVSSTQIDLAEEQMQRIERQTGVLERAATAMRQAHSG